MTRAGAEARRIAEDSLRRAIDRGEVVPGQRLIEAELAERFGVTRSSLRQAIGTLANEGLVERVVNRGARVRELSLDEAVELTECRAVLDGFLVRQATLRADQSDLDNLASQIAAMRATLADGNIMEYMQQIAGLYATIYEIARHDSALALVRRLQAQLVRHQFRLSLRPRRAQVSMRELAEIVDVISQRDADRAEELTRAHLNGTAAALREYEGGHESQY